jgi:hypothetical protein
MIRLLTEGDRGSAVTFLEAEPSFNLLLLGDIENFGFRSEFQQVWGDVSEDGKLRALLLKYYHSYLVYASADFDLPGLARIMQKDRRMEVLSGRAETVEKFRIPLKASKIKRLHFAELDDNALVPREIHRGRVQKATLADIEAIFALKRQIREFKLSPSAEQSFRQTVSSGAGRSFLIKIRDSVVSVASTTAENSRSAMIVGVCTHPDHRNKGFATYCMTALCRELLDEGHTLCLFYNNDAAGSIYRRLGFREIGMWSMLYAGR